MPLSSICPRCGSSNTQTELCTEGPHFARFTCGDCRHFRWLPRPLDPTGAIPTELRSRVHPRHRPAVLRGSDRQIPPALNFRLTMLHCLRAAGRQDLHDLVKCIADAGWFFANRGRAIQRISLPTPDQMESAEPTATCIRCGDPAYDDCLFCSHECHRAGTDEAG